MTGVRMSAGREAEMGRQLPVGGVRSGGNDQGEHFFQTRRDNNLQETDTSQST